MATRRANHRGVAGAPAAAAAASMMASPAAAAASSRADVSAAAAQTPLPVVTLDELVVGAADDLPSEEEQENDDLDVHARPDQHYGNESSSSEDEDDQLGGPDDRDIDQMIADDAAHAQLTAQVNGATGQLMGQAAASSGASGPSASAPAISDGDDAAAPDGAAAAPVIPKGKSPAHFDSEAGNLVFFDLDVEVGGANCGIIQLSAVAHDQAGNPLGQPFNEYVKPWAGARWNTDPDACCHGLSATDRRITTAEDIKVVWKNYLAWSEQFTSDTKKGVITAWNGKGCDIEWIFKTTDVTFARDPTMRQPHNTPYFWDPMKTCKYKKCKINKHLEEHGYALSEAYKAVTPGAVDLPGAHDSLVDAQAQAKIVRAVIDGAKITDLANTTQGIELLADVYKAKREKHARLLQESVRAVPAGWVESDPTKWKCPAGMNYEGGEGGPKSGPTTTGSASANFGRLHVLRAQGDGR